MGSEWSLARPVTAKVEQNQHHVHDQHVYRTGIEAHVWRIAFVVVLGSIMSILDTTIVNVALETLGRDLHSTLADIQWVITGYMLSLAAVIPLTGWAARRFGAKRVYLVSLVALHRRLGAVRPRRLARPS